MIGVVEILTVLSVLSMSVLLGLLVASACMLSARISRKEDE